MAAGCRAGPAAELAYADAPEQQIKTLGSLPVIASFCRRLDISGVIDGLVPIRNVATVSTGQAVEAMVCNRLTWRPGETVGRVRQRRREADLSW